MLYYNQSRGSPKNTKGEKMRKLKQNLSHDEYLQLVQDGAEVKRNYANDTYGASSMGYMDRRGITIDGVDYQVIYTSKAHGARLTQNLVDYNGSWYEKYEYYYRQVNEHFYKNYIKPVEEAL